MFKIPVKKAEKDSLDVVMFKNIVLHCNKKDFGMLPYYGMKFVDCFENRVFNHLDLDKTQLFEMSNVSLNHFWMIKTSVFQMKTSFMGIILFFMMP